ncbi:MAG: hypothetical protein ACM3UZ_00025 [Acidobacteriota bacterium]
MKRHLICVLMIVITVSLTGCSFKLDQTQTFSSTGSVARVDLGDKSNTPKAVSVPAGYPASAVPIFTSSTVVRADKTGTDPNAGYLVDLSSPQQPSAVAGYYQKTLGGASGFQVNNTNNVTTMTGVNNGYKFTVSIFPSKVMKADVTINVAPAK